jgi:hypothetical protein
VADGPLNVENVIVVCTQGAGVGIIAGAIGRRRGALVSAIAIFLPLQIFIALEIIRNRDMSDYIASIYDTKPALWMWIALLPAMICGHFSVKMAQSKTLLSTLASTYGTASCACLIAFHLYTTYTAYELAGSFFTLVTLVTPPSSDVFWLITIWKSTGLFLNIFTLRLLAVIGVIIFGGIFIGMVGLIERVTAKRAIV